MELAASFLEDFEAEELGLVQVDLRGQNLGVVKQKYVG